MKKQLIAVLGAAVLLGGTASAQTMPQSMSSPMGMQPDAAMMMMPTSDAQFVSMISRTNEDDIDLARAVLARSKNDAVKTFAQRTIDDDSSSQVSLRSAARTGSYTVPTYGKRGDVRMGRALLAENEPKLDVDYMQMQLNRNRDTIAVLQWEIKNGTDAGLKAYASAQAPIAAVHAQMALAFGATEGKSTRVNVGGQILGGGASGNGGAAGGNGGGGPYRPNGTTSGNGAPATAPNGTAGNNPASASGGSTTGTANGSGGVKNTPGSKGTSVPISPQTPAPNTAISPSPSPSPT
jgi:putative membrane protein